MAYYSWLSQNEVVWIYHKVEPFFILFWRCEKIMNVFLCVTIGKRVKVYPGIFRFFPISSSSHKKDFYHTTVSIWTFVMARLLPFCFFLRSIVCTNFQHLLPHTHSHPDFTALKLIYYLAQRNIYTHPVAVQFIDKCVHLSWRFGCGDVNTPTTSSVARQAWLIQWKCDRIKSK